MKAVTAHNLLTGEVVYRDAQGAWADHIGAAALYDDVRAEEALAAAKAQATIVTNAYLIGMDAAGVPTHREAMRENIRARGPTNRVDLGKQAEDGA